MGRFDIKLTLDYFNKDAFKEVIHSWSYLKNSGINILRLDVNGYEKFSNNSHFVDLLKDASSFSFVYNSRLEKTGPQSGPEVVKHYS